MSLEPSIVLRHVVQADGTHTAVCTLCGHESRIAVRQKQDKRAPFVTARDPVTGEATETVFGECVEFDFSAHDRHVAQVHG